MIELAFSCVLIKTSRIFCKGSVQRNYDDDPGTIITISTARYGTVQYRSVKIGNNFTPVVTSRISENRYMQSENGGMHN